MKGAVKFAWGPAKGQSALASLFHESDVSERYSCNNHGTNARHIDPLTRSAQ